MATPYFRPSQSSFGRELSMNAMVVRSMLALSVVGVIAVFAAPPSGVLGEHEKFQYKWPYQPGASFVVTGIPYTGHHGCPPGPGQSCTDAWDLVIADDDVRSSAEGTAYEVVSSLPPGTCGPSLGLAIM